MSSSLTSWHPAIFPALTNSQGRARKMCMALESTRIIPKIMLFFAVSGSSIVGDTNISKATFKITVGIILFLVALDMLSAKHQARKRAYTTGESTGLGVGL